MTSRIDEIVMPLFHGGLKTQDNASGKKVPTPNHYILYYSDKAYNNPNLGQTKNEKFRQVRD